MRIRFQMHPASSIPHEARRGLNIEHKAERDNGLRQTQQELHTRAGEKKDNLGSASSRQRFFQYDSPPPVPFSQNFAPSTFKVILGPKLTSFVIYKL